MDQLKQGEKDDELIKHQRRERERREGRSPSGRWKGRRDVRGKWGRSLIVASNYWTEGNIHEHHYNCCACCYIII